MPYTHEHTNAYTHTPRYYPGSGSADIYISYYYSVYMVGPLMYAYNTSRYYSCSSSGSADMWIIYYYSVYVVGPLIYAYYTPRYYPGSGSADIFISYYYSVYVVGPLIYTYCTTTLYTWWVRWCMHIIHLVTTPALVVGPLISTYHTTTLYICIRSGSADKYTLYYYSVYVVGPLTYT